MRLAVTIFLTDETITPTRLARELEQHGLRILRIVGKLDDELALREALRHLLRVVDGVELAGGLDSHDEQHTRRVCQSRLGRPVARLQDIAQAARRELMLCGVALEDAHVTVPSKLLALPAAMTAPLRAYKLFRARRHRAAAKREIDRLHMALHDRASLGVHNADLWSAIMRGVDALALSRWLATDELPASDVRPARQTVQIILRDLTELVALLDELEWPDEAPGASSPPTST